MAGRPAWQVLAVDDDPDAGREVREILEMEAVDDAGTKPEVHVEPSFGAGLIELEKGRYDLVILDVRLGDGQGADDEAGIRALASIRERRFVPVVFYTAIPHAVTELAAPPLVDVVEKTAGSAALVEAVRAAFHSGLPLVNRELVGHVEEIQRKYMWDFVAGNWAELGTSRDRASLAYLLARRLAVSLSGTSVERLAAALGGQSGAVTSDKLPAMRHYLLPPLDERLVGDVLQGTVGERNGYWVLLSPSCDLVQGKADLILLAGADELADQGEAKAWRTDLPRPSKAKTDSLSALMANNRRGGQADRYHFLPGALIIPDLVVDFQRLQSIDEAALDGFQRLASIDSPYAEALVARFVRFYSRLGTPDLDTAPGIERLRALGQLAPTS
jgi:CheY-like chemotaxis protein